MFFIFILNWIYEMELITKSRIFSDRTSYIKQKLAMNVWANLRAFEGSMLHRRVATNERAQ